MLNELWYSARPLGVIAGLVGAGASSIGMLLFGELGFFFMILSVPFALRAVLLGYHWTHNGEHQENHAPRFPTAWHSLVIGTVLLGITLLVLSGQQ